MSRDLSRFLLFGIPWAFAIYGALAISSLPGNWGHGICGAWGCGPTLQSLIGCHVAWFVVLLPAAWFATRLPLHRCKQNGFLLIVISFLAVCATFLNERLNWFSLASESQRQYFIQRVGFVLASTVELPILQTFVAGLLVIVRSGRSRKRNADTIGMVVEAMPKI